MKITDIRVDGFGVWNEMSVDELADGVTLFFGRNEAGKTTLMQFLRTVLYGFSAERRRLYLPPVHGGIPGGLIRVENHNGQFVVERRLAERGENALGRAVVLAANGSRQGQNLLNMLLSGVDESIFNNVFAVGIRELQELATLNDTEAAELLYNLASGVDRVSLVEVMRELETARQQLLRPEDHPSTIRKLLEQQGKLAAEIADLEAQTRRWADLAAERTALVTEVVQLEQRILQLERDARTVEIAIKVRDKWLARHDLERQLAECGHPDPLPEGCVERLDQLNLQILEQKERMQPHQQRRLELRRQLAAQPINRVLWDESSRIEAVCEHGPWIESLDNEIRQLRQELEASEVELLRHEENLAAEGGVALANSPVVSPRVVQQLQAPALALREAIKKHSLVRKQQKKIRKDEEQATNELENELAGKNAESLDDALERTGSLVNQLRRRVKVEDRLEEMWRQQAELEQEHHDSLETQLQRVRILVGVGGMFIFGFVLTLTGLLGWRIMPMSAEISWGVGFLGLVCLGLASAWKVVLERTSQDELTDCIRRRETLEREIEDHLQQREELDRQLPPGSDNFASRLTAAERELKELEAMAPLHHERIDARKRTQEARRQTSTIEEELREARSRWRRGLRQAGLPDSLTPKHVRQLGAHHLKKAKIEERLGRQRERLAKLEMDRNALVDRLRKLHQDVGIHAVGDDPQLQLSQLAAALAGQREMVQRRRELQREEREVRRQLATALQEMRRLRRGRESLFAEARVTDEEELRARVEHLQRAADLNRRHEAVSEQISSIIGGHCPEETIAREIGEYTPENLKHRGSDLVSRLHDCQAHLGQLHLRHGEINQEMKSLAENRRLAAARFEWGCVRQQLADATREWRVLTTTWHLLEHVRVTYEAERQPETLDEASLYLERLTSGKYTRVWTPLGRHELRVDDSAGKPLPLEVLSRGTREAVFLSLRLALVASYGRRGINIPMVLDDVLVNLDAQRAESAVALLCDFAREGRQLLFFTCHDHIRAMFQRANVDVRVLPGHGTPGVRIGRLEMPEPADAPSEIEPAEEGPARRVAEEEPVVEDTDSAADALVAEEPGNSADQEYSWADPEPVRTARKADDDLLTLIATPDDPSEDEPESRAARATLSWDLPEPVRDDEYGLQDAVDRPLLPSLFPLTDIDSDEDPPPAVEEWRVPEPEDVGDDKSEFEDTTATEPVDEVFALASEARPAIDGLWWDVAPYAWTAEE